MTTQAPSHDVAIVGLGVVGIHQLTLEVVETIRRSRWLLVTDTPVGMLEYLRSLCPRVTELARRGDLGLHRALIYRRMAGEVISAALEGGPVCFATYGHPTLYCYPTTLIQRAAQILDLRTVVLPGISSLDTLMAHLGIDPGFDGLQVYEASDVVIRRRPLQNDVGCVIYQASVVLEAHNRLPGKHALEGLRRLEAYLLSFYPPQHVALYVTSPVHPLLEPIAQRIPIGRLAATLVNNSPIGTLYVPPVHRRPIAEPELAEAMTLRESGAAPPPPKRGGRPPIGPKEPAT